MSHVTRNVLATGMLITMRHVTLSVTIDRAEREERAERAERDLGIGQVNGVMIFHARPWKQNWSHVCVQEGGHIPHMREENKCLQAWDVYETRQESSQCIFEAEWVFNSSCPVRMWRKTTFISLVCPRKDGTIFLPVYTRRHSESTKTLNGLDTGLVCKRHWYNHHICVCMYHDRTGTSL